MIYLLIYLIGVALLTITIKRRPGFVRACFMPRFSWADIDDEYWAGAKTVFLWPLCLLSAILWVSFYTTAIMLNIYFDKFHDWLDNDPKLVRKLPNNFKVSSILVKYRNTFNFVDGRRRSYYPLITVLDVDQNVTYRYIPPFTFPGKWECEEWVRVQNARHGSNAKVIYVPYPGGLLT